jgi:hypothetical protein
MKILIYSAMHGRHGTTELFLEGCKRLCRDFDASVFMVCSDEKDVSFLSKRRVDHVVAPNYPVSDKHNKGLEAAFSLDWDYVMIMGSDNIVLSEGVQRSLELKVPHTAFDSVYFVKPDEKAAKRFSYSEIMGVSRGIGCGRLLSRECAEDLFYYSEWQCKASNQFGSRGTTRLFGGNASAYLSGTKNWSRVSKSHIGIWEPHLNRGLDLSLEVLALQLNRPHKRVMGDYCYDFKTSGNVNAYEDRDGIRVDYDAVISRLSDEEKAVLETITK